MVKIRFICPNCKNPKFSPVIFSRSEHIPVCADCGTPFSKFIKNTDN